MVSNHKSGPVFSNVSMIKRALYQSTSRSLPQYEIVLFLVNNWNQISFHEAERLVNIALYAKRSYFQEDEETGLWAIKQQEQTELDSVYRFLRQHYQLFTATQLAKKLKWKDVSRLFVQLASDLRFSSLQFNGEEYWMLSEWVL